MNEPMSNDISKIGVEAVAALKALNAAKAAKKSKAAKATELIEERNEAARPLLQQVHDAIAAGKSVNGHTTWSGWAKYAGWSKRALNYILNGRKKQKGGNSSSRKLLKELLDVINCAPDIHVIRVAAAMIAGEELGGYEPKTKVEVDGIEYETDADRTISSKQFTKLNDTVHIRYSPRKALCQTRFINRKLKHPLYATKGEEPTCEDCIKVRDKVPTKGTLQEARERALAKKPPVDYTKPAIVTHRYGGVTAGGGQNTRMRDYALCGARFSGSSWTTKQKHVSADKDETPTCEKCRKLIAEQQVSEPAQALAAAMDAAPVPQYDREAYAKAETVGQKRCIIGSPENLKWHADLEYRRNNPVVDPNADDEFAGERD